MGAQSEVREASVRLCLVPGLAPSWTSYEIPESRSCWHPFPSPPCPSLNFFIPFLSLLWFQPKDQIERHWSCGPQDGVFAACCAAVSSHARSPGTQVSVLGMPPSACWEDEAGVCSSGPFRPSAELCVSLEGAFAVVPVTSPTSGGVEGKRQLPGDKTWQMSGCSKITLSVEKCWVPWPLGEKNEKSFKPVELRNLRWIC